MYLFEENEKRRCLLCIFETLLRYYVYKVYEKEKVSRNILHLNVKFVVLYSFDILLKRAVVFMNFFCMKGALNGAVDSKKIIFFVGRV